MVSDNAGMSRPRHLFRGSALCVFSAVFLLLLVTGALVSASADPVPESGVPVREAGDPAAHDSAESTQGPDAQNGGEAGLVARVGGGSGGTNAPGGGGSRASRTVYGTLEWKYDTLEVEEISTPALADLDGDGTQEVVFASHGDAVYALSSTGQKLWSNTDNIIEQMDDGHFGALAYEPPPFFSSVMPADVTGTSRPEVLVGVKDGLVCIDPDGTTLWKKGLTTGYYYATPSFTDLQGEYTGERDDMEILCPSDADDRHGWLEAFGTDGDPILRIPVTSGGEGAQIGCAAVSADLDGSFHDVEDDPPLEGEETWHELELGCHDHGMRVYAYSGDQGGNPVYSEVTPANLGGHHTFTTAAVGNFTMNNINPPEEYEVIMGSCEGYQTTWESWGGTIYSYDGAGQLLWSLSTGGSRAAVLSSPAVCDVQMVETLGLDEVPRNEIFVGCDSGKLFCLDADYRQELWSFITSGRMLSSPAVCNIDSDDELEVVVGSNDGYVYCFDGDPTDMGDEGLSDGGGSSGAYDILWRYDTGGPGIGISSPVVADIDNDNMLEVVVGDIGGTVYCIEAGPCYRGQVDWPQFHCDHNRTGFYRPCSKAGVELSPGITDTGPDSMERTVKPGEPADFTIRVKNIGAGMGFGGQDDINVDVCSPGKEGWTAEVIGGLTPVSPDGYNVTLAPGEHRDFVLRVVPPEEAVLGECAAVQVTATSGNDPRAFDTLDVFVVVNFTFDLELGFSAPAPITNDPLSPYNGEKYALLNPGETYTALLRCGNRGDLNDTFELGLEGFPGTWDVRFRETGAANMTLSLPSITHSPTGYWSEAAINVTPPAKEYPGSLVNLRATAHSVKSVSLLTPDDGTDIVEARDECWLEVDETRNFTLEVGNPVRHVDPGCSVAYTANVTNLGNGHLDLGVDIEMSDDRRGDMGWEARFTDRLRLNPGETESFEIELTAPPDLPAYEESRFTLTCVAETGEGEPVEGGPKVSLDLAVIANRVARLNATLSVDVVSLDPGGVALVEFAVVNEGNHEDELTAVVVSPAGGPGAVLTCTDWDVAGDEIYIPVDVMYEPVIYIYIRAPLDGNPGRYRVAVNLTGDGTVVNPTLTVTVIVNQVYDATLQFVGEGEVMGTRTVSRDTDPGSTVTREVELSNRGNGFDNVTLAVSCSRPEWSCHVSSITTTGGGEPSDLNFDPNRTLALPSSAEPRIYRPTPGSGDVGEVVLGLEANMTVRAVIEVRVPRDALNMNTASIDFEAITSGVDRWPANDDVELRLRVLMADLTFTTDLYEFEDIPDDRVVQVDTAIVNQGVFSAGDFRVALMVGDGVEDETTVRALAPGLTLPVQLNWSVPKDYDGWDVRVVIDPDDTVVESDETNNEQMVVQRAEEPREEPNVVHSGMSKVSLSLLLAAVAVAIAVASALALIAVRRRAARKDGDGEAAGPALVPEVEKKAARGATPKPLAAGPVIDVGGPTAVAPAPAPRPMPAVKTPTLAPVDPSLTLPPAQTRPVEGSPGGGGGPRGE